MLLVLGPLDLAWVKSLAYLVVQLVDGGSWDFLTSMNMAAISCNKSPSLCISRCSCFWKFTAMPLRFYEGTTLLPAFAYQKKSKGIFAFMKNDKMQKWCSALVWEWTVTEAVHTQGTGSGITKHCPSEHTLSTWASGHQNFEPCLWASVLSSVCFVPPLISCVLRYQESLKGVIFGGLGILRSFPI